MNAGPAGTNGGLAANRLAHDADVVIGIGTRMGDFVTASRTTFQHPDATFIGINIGPMDAHKLRALPVVADAREAITALEAQLAAAGYKGTAAPYRKRITDLKREWDDIVTKLRAPDGAPGDLGQAEVIGIVNDAVGGHATVICAAGSLPGDLLRLWRPEDPKAYHVEYGFSCMGYEIVAGLGVRLADPDREVVVMVGDGSYLMLNSEIVTAVAEGLKFTIVLLDNHGFQCILALQRMVGVPDFGNELRFRDPKTQPADRPVRAGRLPGPRRVDGRPGHPRLHPGRAARRPRPGAGRRPDHRDLGPDRAREADARLRVVVGRARWPARAARSPSATPAPPTTQAPHPAHRHPVDRRRPCPDPGSSSSAPKRRPR